MAETIQSFTKDFISWISGSISIGVVLEIFILSICAYYIMLWFKTTRAWTLLKGLVIILFAMLLASIFNMQVISAILNSCFSVGIIALIILFQPELRKALEQLGRKRLISDMFTFDDTSKNLRFSDESKEALIEACFEMGATMTGALIVIENRTALGDYEKTGIPLDAKITTQLLVQIFEHNTPLHDGAIIIRNDRIVAATCYLPVSSNMMISKALGTRHRAALGISEVSDSLTLIVSEETGKVSIASSGEIKRSMDQDTLRKYLEEIQNKPVESKSRWKRKGKKSNEKNTAK